MSAFLLILWHVLSVLSHIIYVCSLAFFTVFHKKFTYTVNVNNIHSESGGFEGKWNCEAYAFLPIYSLLSPSPFFSSPLLKYFLLNCPQKLYSLLLYGWFFFSP